MTGERHTDVYVTTLAVGEIFADRTYQRECDVTRARKMAHSWDRRLAGIVEVSDRGEDSSPRFAIIDGQHRWAAAKSLINPPQLVANVHEGLTVEQEAQLFDKLNRQRKQPTTWDHWKARRASGDEFVQAVEATVERVGLTVSPNPKDGNVRCIGALEKIAKSTGGQPLLKDALQVIHDTWGTQFDAYDAPLVSGMAVVLTAFGERVDWEILIDGLIDLPPRRIKYLAQSKRDTTSGSLTKLAALTIIDRYNTAARTNPKLRIPTGFTGTLRAAPKAAA